MARGGQDRKRQRDQLRQTLQHQGHTLEQIATAMARGFRDRPRSAWRHAHGWTQQDVADRYNREVNDSNASMTAHRISDFERWPINGAGTKPTIPTLGVLAKIYATKVSKLVDRHDRQKMSAQERILLAVIDSGVIPQQLPSVISNFVGRAHELDILTAQLNRAAEDSGTVVITAIGGTAGIGKTTLALYWTRAHIDQFPEGQLYVDLRGFDPSGTPVTPQQAIRGFLDAFQIPAEKIPTSLDDQAALYRTLVEDRRLVIVLDNARDADQIWLLLPGSPSCLVLVTSRQQLPSLIARKHATHITLEFMTTDEAHQLLTNFLGKERIQDEPQAVDELIRYCIGLPIALSIAAARIRLDPHLPLSTLVGQLRGQRHRLDALATGDSQLTDIRAVFSWSYTALSTGAARLFRLLGLHPGPDISTLAAASLVGLPEHDTSTLLVELTQAHLIKQHSPGRYQLHDLLRVYASEQAAQDEPEPQRRAALHRVLDYYLHTGFAANRRIAPHRRSIALEAPQSGIIPDQITSYEQGMTWFTVEHAVLLAVINRAATLRFDAHAWQLPWTLVSFFDHRGYWHDWAVTQQCALSAAERLDDHAVQAAAHRELGQAHACCERYAEALASFQQALILYQNLGDRNGQAHTHLALGWISEQQNRYTQALNHGQRALRLYHAISHRIGEARALNNLGWYHAQLGDYQQALNYCEQALDIQHKLDDRVGAAETLDSLGYIHHHLGHHDKAISHYQHAVVLRQELGSRYFKANSLSRLGDTYQTTGNLAAAREAWQQALTIFEQLDHPDAEQVRSKLETLATGPDPDDTDTGASH
jgi:tetratricopeptide (TPR) repeat protein